MLQLIRPCHQRRRKKFYNIDTRSERYKTFCVHKLTFITASVYVPRTLGVGGSALECLKINEDHKIQGSYPSPGRTVYVSGRPVQPSLMFRSQARAYIIEAPFMCSTIGSTHKHYTRLEGPAKSKHSSLLVTLVNYGRKTFYNIWPRLPRHLLESVVFEHALLRRQRRDGV